MKRPSRKTLTLPFIILTIAAAVFLVRNLDFLRESPFAFSRPWQTPSEVAVAADGSRAVVENSKMTVTITDPEGRLRARIHGGTYDLDSFYYAEHVALDGENLIIAEVRHAESSTFVQGERILRYDLSGRLLQTLYSVTYDGSDRPRQLGRIRSVKLEDGQVTYTWVNGSQAGASLCKDGTVEDLATVSLVKDDFLHVAYEPHSGALCFTTKKGALGVARAGDPPRMLPYGNGNRVPWGVDMATDGTLYLSELLSESVLSIRGNTVSTLWQGGLVYDLCAAPDGVAFTDGEQVRVTGVNSAVTHYIPYSPAFTAMLITAWAAAVYLSLCVLWLILRLALLLRGQPVSETRRRMLIASVSVLITVVLVMAFLLSFVQRQMQSQTLQSLSQLAESISVTSGTVIGDHLKAIRTLNDYRGRDYNAVRAYMDAFCDASYRNGSNLYYILYQFDDSLLWGVMDYENTTGTRYPYCPLENTVYGEVAATGESRRVEGEANIYGMWSYAVAPVYDSQGGMTGLLEIGTNQYGEVVARQETVRNLLTMVFVALLMAMLAFNEATAFHDHLSQRRVYREKRESREALGFIRALIFLVFMADNMDASFIPQLSAWLGLQSVPLLNVSLASALPMSLQLLVIGLSAYLAGRFLDRSHPRAVLTVGLALQIAGALTAIAAVLAEQYWLFLVAKAVGGLGTGASVVTCNAMPGRTRDAAEQQSLIAGLNVGVITGVVLGSSVGGYLADYLGYTATYLGSIVCVLAAVPLMWRSLRGIARVSPDCAEEKSTAKRGETFRFLANPRVFGFLLFIMLPYMLMMYFKDYLFPLFAAGLGKTESVIGSVMLLGGVLAIFLGEAVPGALLDRLGAWNALRLSNLACVFALGLFALNPRFETAVVTVCLLGVAASFGYAAQGVYYNDLIRRERIGDGKAMGVYSLFDNLGQTSGPLALSALLFLGVAMECGAIALGGAAMLLVSTLLRRLTERRAFHE